MTDNNPCSNTPPTEPNQINSVSETNSNKSSQPETVISARLTNEKPDGDTNKIHSVNQEQSNKLRREKGFHSESSANEKPLFGEQESKPKDYIRELSSQSSAKEDNKFSRFGIGHLQTLQGQTIREIESLGEQYNDLSDHIGCLRKDKGEVRDSSTEERKIQKKLDRSTQERDEIESKLEQLQADKDAIEEELSKKRSTKSRDERNQDGVNRSDKFEEAEDVSAELLFRDSEPIHDAVLYVATFFPKLNPHDFKRVVALLLEGWKITVKQSFSSEEGKSQKTEGQTENILKEKTLSEIWKESFNKPDQYLRDCYLKVDRQYGTQAIDFSLPHLREDFLTYFADKQPLYLEEQLRRTQELNLLLDSSEEVADKAIEVAVKAAVYYPNTYKEEWLLEIFRKIVVENEERITTLLERLAELIYLLQTKPEYSKSQNIAQNFLNKLIRSDRRNQAFAIVEYLIDEHLCFGFLGIEPAKQLLAWMRGLLDQENSKQKDWEMQTTVYSSVENMLWRSGYSRYIYDFLGILKEWLPKKDIPVEAYSPSNQTALLLLFNYCDETTLYLDLDSYGFSPSKHPLFASLQGDSNSKFSEELNTLVSWLLYPSSSRELAIKQMPEGVGKIYTDPFKEISFLFTEWFVILCGFEEQSKQEAWDLFHQMIHYIILNTSRLQQRQITDYWTEIIEEYLDRATEYETLSNKDFKRQFVIRRKLIRELKKEFTSVRKEALASK